MSTPLASSVGHVVVVVRCYFVCTVPQFHPHSEEEPTDASQGTYMRLCVVYSHTIDDRLCACMLLCMWLHPLAVHALLYCTCDGWEGVSACLGYYNIIYTVMLMYMYVTTV